jgi:hypothetical protein
MGKSAFFRHLQAALTTEPGLQILSFPGPPLARGKDLVADDILGRLLDELLEQAARYGKGRDDKGAPDQLGNELCSWAAKLRLQELLETYLDGLSTDIERVVLLYDELDRYADASRVARDYFNALEDARKNLDGRLVVVAAGGLGTISLKTVLGSSIFTRSVRKILDPFQDEELAELARDFGHRGVELSAEVLATLRVLSGGNVALATHGLEKLWDIDEPSPRHLQQVFDRFADEHADFGASIRSAVFGFHESEIPVHVWRHLKQTGGRLARSELDAIRAREQVGGAIERKDILDMLRASGFIRMADSGWKDDPIVAEIIPSILSFDASVDRPSLATLAEQLRADLLEAMADIHRMKSAFYRPATKEEAKQLLPEAAFAVGLALSLGGRGWKAELEPMSGAGYADIKARYPTRFGEEWAIIEVKLWRNSDVATIHDQVTSYFAKGVTALATVVIADHKDPDWKDEYQRKCLAGKVDGAPTWRALEAPLEGYFEALWGARGVEHFLLRLRSRS